MMMMMSDIVVCFHDAYLSKRGTSVGKDGVVVSASASRTVRKVLSGMENVTWLVLGAALTACSDEQLLFETMRYAK